MTAATTHDVASPGEVTVRFHAWPGNPHMLQRLAECQTVLMTGPNPEGPLRIIGVTLNGAALKLRRIDDSTVSVSPPIPEHWDRVELHCVALYAVPKAPQRVPQYGPPAASYGLQPAALTIPKAAP